MGKIIGNTVGVPNPQTDWNQTDSTKADFLKNKPNMDLYGNALKGSVSGASVFMDDVSPVEHRPTISIETESSENITLYACSKNMLDKDKATISISNVRCNERDGDKFTLQGNYSESALGWGTGVFQVKTPYYMQSQNNVYTLSFYITLLEQGEHDNRVRLLLFRDSNNMSSVDNGWSDRPYLTVGVRTKVTVQNILGKPFREFWMYLNSNKVLIELDTMQIEYGNTATEFEQYEGQSYSVNADGTVEGVKLLSPVTNLTTDNLNAVIHCDYNKDTNKVIEKLTNAIISLGGNV